jgi:hypothetical protein
MEAGFQVLSLEVSPDGYELAFCDLICRFWAVHGANLLKMTRKRYNRLMRQEFCRRKSDKVCVFNSTDTIEGQPGRFFALSTTDFDVAVSPSFRASHLLSIIDFHILNFTALSVVGVLQYSLLPLAL